MKAEGCSGVGQPAEGLEGPGLSWLGSCLASPELGAGVEEEPGYSLERLLFPCGFSCCMRLGEADEV